MPGETTPGLCFSGLAVRSLRRLRVEAGRGNARGETPGFFLWYRGAFCRGGASRASALGQRVSLELWKSN